MLNTVFFLIFMLELCVFDSRKNFKLVLIILNCLNISICRPFFPKSGEKLVFCGNNDAVNECN